MKHASFGGGWAVVMLLAAACAEDSAPQRASAPASPDTGSRATSGSDPSGSDTSGSDTSGQDVGDAPNPGEENAAPNAGEPGSAPSTPSMEGESPTPPLDLATATPVMAAAPAEPADGTPDDSTPDDSTPDDTAPEVAPWKVLFNGQNLDGWTASRGTGDGQTIAEIFQVTDGMLHVYKGAVQGSTQPNATLRTNDSYSNYVFQFEYMWGTARFSDRSNADRDAGVLFHMFNNLNAVWPDAIEFQMGSSPLTGEYISGDIFMIGTNPRAQTTSIRSGNNFVFAEPELGGMRRSIGAPNNYERARTDAKRDQAGWNTIELTVKGGAEAEYKVNGVVANRLFNLERNMGNGVFQPLQSGPIALQAEFAELFYRNIRVRELP
jgi:hypothetical protein